MGGPLSGLPASVSSHEAVPPDSTTLYQIQLYTHKYQQILPALKQAESPFKYLHFREVSQHCPLMYSILKTFVACICFYFP